MDTPYVDLIVSALTKVFLEVSNSVLGEIDHRKISIRVGDNIQTINSPVSISAEFFVLNHNLEDDQGVCLSVSFQNHEPIVGGLNSIENGILFAYADLSYLSGKRISHFGVIKLDRDSTEFKSNLEECVNSIMLYLKSQTPLIGEKLNEILTLTR